MPNRGSNVQLFIGYLSSAVLVVDDNSAFAATVMAGFFPVFFKEYWNAGVSVTESTFRLGMANSLASLLIVVMAPVLGAVADTLGRRKGMLMAFACLGILMTAGLYLVEEGEWGRILRKQHFL
jgi:UMF1 family MFS transporter